MEKKRARMKFINRTKESEEDPNAITDQDSKNERDHEVSQNT